MSTNLSNHSIYNRISNIMDTGSSRGPFTRIRFIESERILMGISELQLLYSMKKLTSKEVGNLIGMMKSDDNENLTVAEECIKQKFAEL